MSAEIVWKKIDGIDEKQVSMTHFSSHCIGHQVYVKKIEPAVKKSKKSIRFFILHDLTSYHGRFIKFVNWIELQNLNTSFMLMDFIGHGLSSGTRSHILEFNDLVYDAKTFIEIAGEKQEGEEWIILAHGLGALVTLDLINRFTDSVSLKIDRLILSNFALNFSSSLLDLEDTIYDKSIILRSLIAHTRPIEIYRPHEVLSDIAPQAIYREDPLINRRPTYMSFLQIRKRIKGIYQDAYFVDKPTLLLKSEGVYLFKNVMDFFSKGFKKGFLTEKKYSNLRHDLYNEKDSELVFNDILEWITNE